MSLPTRESKLQIDEQQRGDIVVLALRGQMTLDDGDLAFGRYVDTLIEQGRVKIILDLSQLTYIDSAGIGMMVAEMKRVRERRGDIRLATLNAHSDHLFAMLKLKLVFEIFEDVDKAARSFAWRAQ